MRHGALRDHCFEAWGSFLGPWGFEPWGTILGHGHGGSGFKNGTVWRDMRQTHIVPCENACPKWPGDANNSPKGGFGVPGSHPLQNG